MAKEQQTSPDAEAKKSNTGLKAVLNKALEAYDKLPMLETVFERLARLLTTALRNLTSETVDITIKNFNSQRFGSYYNTIKPLASIAVFKVIEWENLGLIVIDSALIFSLVDLLFGGKKNHQAVRVEGRAHTYIEQALIKQIAEVVLSELSSSFDPISPATCVLERLESNPTFAAISRPSDAVIILQLQINLEDRGGLIDIIIPYTTFEPIKPLLQQVFIGERFGENAEWEENLLNCIYNIEIPIEAVIVNKNITISSLSHLKIGDTVMTEHALNEDIVVQCNGVKLFNGQMGQIEDKVAINITNTIVDQK